MWMLLGPSFIPGLFDAGPFVSVLVLAVWCGDEDGTGLDLRVVVGMTDSCLQLQVGNRNRGCFC